MSSRPLSFNERLASVRTDETAQAEKRKRIIQSRTQAFALGQEENNNYKTTAVDIPDEAPKAPVFSREEVMAQKWRPGGVKRSNTTSSIPATRADTNHESKSSSKAGKTTQDDASEASFEAFSSLHLSKRFLPQRVLARQVYQKKTMTIKDTLREVKAPDFTLPDVEQDVVVLGIVAKKSEPRAHKPGPKQAEDRGKYMVMSICDLDFEVDLFLFDTGFERFWKLTEGTVVAILNPGVMPPPPGRQDTGKFSLVINSDEDTIIEIGLSRDLGSCQSLRKDGAVCGAWVNKKRTHFCEFHTNEALKKTRSSRIEFNSHSSMPFSPTKKGKQKRGGWLSKINDDKEQFQSRGPRNYDWETKTKWYASRSMSSADLIDGKDITAEDRAERRAHLKRSLEAKEKEREMMKTLGKFGDGAGKLYMKQSGSGKRTLEPSQTPDATQEDAEASRQAALKSLDLQSKDRKIQLGPVKRKRLESPLDGPASRTSTALGWGGGLKDKLARMKEGEKLHKENEGARSPVRKKTRFVTEKGIRVAGRESLGEELAGRQISFDNNDDDDELVIIA